MGTAITGIRVARCGIPMGLKNAKWLFFVLKSVLFWKKVCYKVYLCDKQQSYKAFTGLSNCA